MINLSDAARRRLEASIKKGAPDSQVFSPARGPAASEPLLSLPDEAAHRLSIGIALSSIDRSRGAVEKMLSPVGGLDVFDQNQASKSGGALL